MKRIMTCVVAVILTAWLSAGCNSEIPELPEGYKVLCSLEGDKYSLRFPSGVRSASVWKSEKRAIEFATHWEEVKSIPFVADSDNYEWSECR